MWFRWFWAREQTGQSLRSPRAREGAEAGVGGSLITVLFHFHAANTCCVSVV